MTDASAAPRLLIVLPYDMTVRNWFATPVAAELAKHGAHLTFVTRDPADAAAASALSPPAAWLPLCRPSRTYRGFDNLLADIRWIVGFWLHLVLVFRHSSIHHFRGFLDRLRQSRPLRRKALKEGLPSRHWLGFPFPRSQSIYDALHRLYWAGWIRHPSAESALDQARPDAVVLGHCQNHFVAPYALAAHARGIPVLGVNGSWDQPTTKGPVVPRLARMLVQSRNVLDELAAFHDVPRESMAIVGWPQFDIYAKTPGAAAKAPHQQILVGAYSERLGRHEPEMCRQLAARLRQGDFGTGATLLIRCHPLDTRTSVAERFGPLNDPPRVVVSEPGLGKLDTLRDIIENSNCVIASAGTINLDAVALDRPSIAIAFEDESEPYYDRASRRYAMEHIAGVTSTGGILLVKTQAELESAVATFMKDPTHGAAERAILRRDHLEPLDGRASERLATGLIEAARGGKTAL